MSTSEDEADIFPFCYLRPMLLLLLVNCPSGTKSGMEGLISSDLTFVRRILNRGGQFVSSAWQSHRAKTFASSTTIPAVGFLCCLALVKCVYKWSDVQMLLRESIKLSKERNSWGGSQDMAAVPGAIFLSSYNLMSFRYVVAYLCMYKSLWWHGSTLPAFVAVVLLCRYFGYYSVNVSGADHQSVTFGETTGNQQMEVLAFFTHSHLHCTFTEKCCLFPLLHLL